MKKMVFVIDMINGFCKEGALADPKIMGIVPELHEFLKNYEGEKICVRDCHDKDALEFFNFPPHCEKDNKESELIDELKDVLTDAKDFPKNSTCALFAPGMMEYLKKGQPEEIVVTGCCTDICVLNFVLALKNFFNQEGINCNIVVYKELVDTYDAPNHNRDVYNDMAFTLMQQCGVKVQNLVNEKIFVKET